MSQQPGHNILGTANDGQIHIWQQRFKRETVRVQGQHAAARVKDKAGRHIKRFPHVKGCHGSD